jgi:hypothetical protein
VNERLLRWAAVGALAVSLIAAGWWAGRATLLSASSGARPAANPRSSASITAHVWYATSAVTLASKSSCRSPASTVEWMEPCHCQF